MSRLLIITGTPGVGKSTLARFLSKKLMWPRLDLHHYYRQVSVAYNSKRRCYEVDLKKFEKLVKEKLEVSPEGLILDTHISHLIPQKMITLGIVLTCSNLKLLQRRLKRRKYSPAKIRENLDAEIFQVCLLDAQERKLPLLVFDVGKKFSKEKIWRALQQKLKPKSL